MNGVRKRRKTKCFDSLLTIVNNNNVKECRRLLNYDDTQVNCRNKFKTPVLIVAAREGYVGIVELLLARQNIQINLCTEDKETALFWAALKGHIDVVKLLLAHKDIRVNIPDWDGSTALLWAIRANYIEIAKLLLVHPDIQVNHLNKDEYCALYYAAREGHIEIVKLLLTRPDIQVNLKCRWKSTALLKAAVRGHTKIVELLLAHGASVCVTDIIFTLEINRILDNWKTYLPKWNRFKTCKYYPREFNKLALAWLLCCKRLKVFPKDIRYLMIEYIAVAWKLIKL